MPPSRYTFPVCLNCLVSNAIRILKGPNCELLCYPFFDEAPPANHRGDLSNFVENPVGLIGGFGDEINF